MSLTKVTYSMIVGASVNVFDFGATGNGSSDDTAAIQAAIDYAEASATPPSAAPGVVQVYFPFGRYIITDALTVTKSLSFVGEGHSEYSTGARIIQNTAAKDHFLVQPISAGCSVSWDDLTLTANGNGNTGGACINIEKTAGTCNSIRIRRCTFGTPQNFSVKIQAGDDIQISECLFDVSARECLALGTSTAADVVSNCAITNNAFFGVSLDCVEAYNVDGLIIANNRVYPSGAGVTNVFFEGTNTLPYQIKNVTVSGNTFKNVECIANLTDVEGISITGNNGVNLGGSSLSGFEMAGACTNVSFTGNVLSGDFGAEYFFNDAGGTLSGLSLSSNTFYNEGATGQAINVPNAFGFVGENAVIGFTTPCVGEQWYTTGNAISPGVINSLASYTYTATVNGAKQGDKVTLTPSSTTWPAPAGIVVTAYISAANTVSIKYTNVTGSPIGVPAHDFGVLVTR